MNLIGLPDSFGRLCALTFLLSTSSQPIHGWSSTTLMSPACAALQDCQKRLCRSSVEERHRASCRLGLLPGLPCKLLKLTERRPLIGDTRFDGHIWG